MRFDRCAELVRDTVHPKDVADLPYIGLEHIAEGQLALTGHGIANQVTSVKSRFREGDILFGKLRPYFRKVVVAPFDGICSTDIWVVRPREGIDRRYLFYWMASREFIEESTRASEGTRMPRAQWGFIGRIEKPVPPLPEQRAIACILGALDDKIELNRRMNETLEAMARAIFKSWFVDFDPVRAKAEGQQPPGLAPHIADLFPDAFEESELGEIPKGWTITNLGDKVKIVKGRSYKSSELLDSDTALVTLKSFARGGGYRPDGLKPYVGPYKPEQVVQPGELVVACTDVTQAAEVVGRPAIVRGNRHFETLVASLDTLILRPNGEDVTRAFLYFLGGTDSFNAHMYAHTTGTTVLHLAKDAVPLFQFAHPGKELVQVFDRLAALHLSRIDAAATESDMLAELRDTLLPKLISGELRLLDAERIVGRCV
jgi:type I restriction enzyme S subunit